MRDLKLLLKAVKLRLAASPIRKGMLDKLPWKQPQVTAQPAIEDLQPATSDAAVLEAAVAKAPPSRSKTKVREKAVSPVKNYDRRSLPPVSAPTQLPSYTKRLGATEEAGHGLPDLAALLEHHGLDTQTGFRDPLEEATAEAQSPEKRSLASAAGHLYRHLRQGKSVESFIKESGVPRHTADHLRLAAAVLPMVDHATHYLATANDSGKDWYGKQLESYVDGIREIAQKRWGFSPEVFGQPGDGFSKKALSPAMKAYMSLTAITSVGATPTMNAKMAYNIFDKAVGEAKQNGDHPLSAFHRLPLYQDGGKKSWTMAGNTNRGLLTQLSNLFHPRGDETHEQAIERGIGFLDSEHAPQHLHDMKRWMYGAPGASPKASTVYGDDRAHPGSFALGPKVGSFYQNLTGDANHLTADLWWSRTWGRLVGNFWESAPKKDQTGKPILDPTTGKQARETFPKKSPKDTEREIMDRAARVGAAHLGLEVADFQAVLWYYEKALYEAVGAPAEKESYEKGIGEVHKLAGVLPNRGPSPPASVIRQNAPTGESLRGYLRSPKGQVIRKVIDAYRIRKSVAFGAASPNVDDLSFDEAAARLKGDGHVAFREMAANMAAKIGLKGNVHDAIGDWSDGAENSLAHFFHEPVDEGKLDYLMAWMGKLGRQKAILKFMPHPEGTHSLFDTTVPETDLARVRQRLDTHKVPFRTLIPQPNGTRVLVADLEGTMTEPVSNFARTYNANVQQTRGNGQFIGADSREDAAKKFQAIIDKHEPQHPAPDGGASAGPPGPRKSPGGGLIHRGQFHQGGTFLPKPPTV